MEFWVFYVSLLLVLFISSCSNNTEKHLDDKCNIANNIEGWKSYFECHRYEVIGEVCPINISDTNFYMMAMYESTFDTSVIFRINKMHKSYWFTVKFIIPVIFVRNIKEYNKRFVSKYETHSWQIEEDVIDTIRMKLKETLFWDIATSDTIEGYDKDGIVLFVSEKDKKKYVWRTMHKENKEIIDVLLYFMRKADVIDEKDRTSLEWIEQHIELLHNPSDSLDEKVWKRKYGESPPKSKRYQ